MYKEYIQINELPEEHELRKLDNQLFVEITEGDFSNIPESKVREPALSFRELLRILEPEDSIGFTEIDKTVKIFLKEYLGYREEQGFWSGQTIFTVPYEGKTN